MTPDTPTPATLQALVSELATLNGLAPADYVVEPDPDCALPEHWRVRNTVTGNTFSVGPLDHAARYVSLAIERRKRKNAYQEAVSR